VGLDFRTALGQIVQAMIDEASMYAIAVPDPPSFMGQCRRVPEWVRVSLRLAWLVVCSDGSVRVVAPDRQP
jgi:hypothetical protein